MTLRHRTDVAIIGAGALGLAHAYQARRRGLHALVVSPDGPDQGMSADTRLGWASSLLVEDSWSEVFEESARAWAGLAQRLGFWASRSGSLIVARSSSECNVLEELSLRRSHLEVRELNEPEVALATGFRIPGLRRAVQFPTDVVLDLRAALSAMACHLDDRGVPLLWRREIRAVELTPGGSSGVRLETTDGQIDAGMLIVCDPSAMPSWMAGGRAASSPTAAPQYGVALRSSVARACPAIVSGSSMLGLPALASTEASDALFEEYVLDHTELMRAGIRLTVWPTPAGTLCGGSITSCDADNRLTLRDLGILVEEASRLLGAPLSASHVWTHPGIEQVELAVSSPAPQVRVVTAPSVLRAGAAFGLARRVLDDVCDTGFGERGPDGTPSRPGDGRADVVRLR